ncbi:MAG: tetratricopeptide repeat protein [Nitrososphaeraceae archaeon]|nr:tetratricopeptide repeat protein [Nitrososphaeraceae archaeon]MBV9667425.1 tetratricopeptide repeat protein [Nitrososphaeraceae archaeon]
MKNWLRMPKNYGEANDHKNALECFEETLKLDPDYAKAPMVLVQFT